LTHSQQVAAIKTKASGAVDEGHPRAGQLSSAVINANVLYGAFVTDVILRLAAEDLFLPLWTMRIHEEWLRNLVAKRPDLCARRLETRLDQMLAAFPDALVPPSRGLKRLFPNVDAKDRHVAAAARKAKATRIVTFNTRDFPRDDLAPYGIAVRNPDEFLCDLAREMPNHVYATLMNKHRSVLRRPSMSRSDYLTALGRHGLRRIANLLDD
jgi:hypothetical protein